MQCSHENFQCSAGIHRLTKDEGGPVAYYSAEIQIWCQDCGHKFEFIGLPLGSSPYRPTASLDGLILHAPMMPEGVPVPEGLPSIGCSFMGGEQ